MKVILDCSPEIMGTALQAAYQVMRDNPPLGLNKSKKVVVQSLPFSVRRNANSLTVEQK